MTILTNFQPRRREISAVTNEQNALITTTEDHGYEVGQIVRLYIPSIYGMTVEYVITTVSTVPSTDTFTVTLDTRELDTYTTPNVPYTSATDPPFTQSHVVPVTGRELNNTSITG